MNTQQDSNTEYFYDFSRAKNQWGVQTMKNGLFVGPPIWVDSEEEAKQKIEELKRTSK